MALGIQERTLQINLRHFLYLAIAACLPILPALLSGEYPADPNSELPVKLWVYATFAESGHWLGGPMPAIAFPKGGPLNNPDIFGSLWMHIGSWLPQSVRYGLMIVFIQWLNMLSLYVLAKSWTQKSVPALGAALCFGLCAALQGYVIGGAITDMLHVWPYPLAIWAGLKAFEAHRYRWGILSAVFFGLGFVTCPYNAVVFAPVALPVACYLFKHRELLSRKGMMTAGILGLSSAVLIGLYALQLKGVMSAADSQMSSELVQSTRHQWPFLGLTPDHPDRYVASLVDYLTLGKDKLIVRDSGARFYRAYSLGWLGLGIAFWGLRKARTSLWLWVFSLGILLSIGPFLSLTDSLYVQRPSNPIYLAFFYAWPGTQMILEPFRYQLVATLGLCMLIATGLSTLQKKTLQSLFLILLPLELCLFSTAPFPQIQSDFKTPDIYRQIASDPQGGIIELPYHHQQSRLFVRQHFLNQRTHQHPIINEVAGFLPALFFENPFLARLMIDDAPHPVPTGRNGSAEAGAQSLYQIGFRTLIFTPEYMVNEEAAMRTRQRIEKMLGPPILEGDGRLIYAFQDASMD